MKISERCSCGAKITIEHRLALSIVKDWRKQHTCLESPADLREGAVGTTLDLATTRSEPDFKIGFNYTETEEDE